MGTILSSTLIASASELAQDDTNEVWSTPEALGWLNDGQRSVCILRPDANVLNHSVVLIPGTKQTITGRRIMDIMRNMGSDGNTPGRAITIVDKKVMDEFNFDWHIATPATVIEEYMYDIRDPNTFYVSPPADGATPPYVEISEAVNPTDMTVTTDPIDLNDIYAPALIEWMCYRFFGRDSEVTPSHGRALSYLQNFYGLLGKKFEMDLLAKPKTNTED